MRKSTLGILTGLIFLLGQGAAMAADDSRCLKRDEREGQNVYAARLQNSCDARWRRCLPVRPTSGKAYDDYMRRCEKRCAAVISGGVLTGALLAGGALVAGGAAVAASAKGGGSPASP